MHQRKTNSSPSVGLSLEMQDGVIELNVGGRLFGTTYSTLSSRGDCFFTRLLSGRVGVVRDKEGAIFIDRSPEPFAVVLDYLRTGKLRLRDVDKQEVLDEADFYGINLREVVEHANAVQTAKQYATVSQCVNLYNGVGVHGAKWKKETYSNGELTSAMECLNHMAREGWELDSVQHEGRWLFWTLSRNVPVNELAK